MLSTNNAKRIYTFVYKNTGEKYTVKANNRIEALLLLRKLTLYPADLYCFSMSYKNIGVDNEKA